MSKSDLTGIGEINALLGRGTQYEGKLTFEGRVRIDGTFRGEVRSEDTLVVGDGAELHAQIDVGTLIVRGGEVHGDIKAKHLVEIHYPAKVFGNIHTPQIFVDRGVVFEGQCTMPKARVHDMADEGAGDEASQGAIAVRIAGDMLTPPLGQEAIVAPEKGDARDESRALSATSADATIEDRAAAESFEKTQDETAKEEGDDLQVTAPS